MEGSRPAASGMSANENWVALSKVRSARERGWGSACAWWRGGVRGAEVAKLVRDLVCDGFHKRFA